MKSPMSVTLPSKRLRGMPISEEHSRISHRSHGTGCDAWNADIESARFQLAKWISRAIDEEFGTAIAAEQATGVSHTEFSRIRNGKLTRFTVDRLVQLLNAVDKEIEVRLKVEIRRRTL